MAHEDEFCSTAKAIERTMFDQHDVDVVPALRTLHSGSYSRAVPIGRFDIDVIPDLAALAPGAAMMGHALRSTLRRAFSPLPGEDGAVPEYTAAVEEASRARTAEQLGLAFDQLRQEKRLTRGEIARRDGGNWLSKSTVSRVCSGKTLFRHREQVVAFVAACGVSDEDWRWVQYWKRVREHRSNERGAPPGSAVLPTGVQPEAGPTGVVDDTAGTGQRTASGPEDDEILKEFHVKVTRAHLRQAAPMLAMLGLLGTTCGDAPATRALGTAALALAGGLVLIEWARATTQAASEGTGPEGDQAGAGLTAQTA